MAQLPEETLRTGRRLIYRAAEDAAAREGKTVGEWLFEALREHLPKMTLTPNTNPRARERYQRAAEDLLDKFAAAMLPEKKP